MDIAKPDGTPWHLERANEKLALRAGLPGARVFDLAADTLRRAKERGLSARDRLTLALPASWCVNSPADSRVLRRWLVPPQDDVWLTLLELFDEPRTGPLPADASSAVTVALQAIAPEPFGVEAVSKVLALLLPDRVPLMPAPALSFVLGGSVAADASAFVAMIDWFATAVAQARVELHGWAAAQKDTVLTEAQVLDRLLWFDSEGHRHFKPRAEALSQ